MGALELLRLAYGPLIAFARAADESAGWAPTQLPGWSVRDLIFHLAADAQRALVALAQPSRRDHDSDEVSYWRSWRPGTDAAAASLRAVRIFASAFTSVRGPADLYVLTAEAVLAVAERSNMTDSVSTQGHTMSVDALLRTLVIEATIHHLDLQPALATPPDPATLAEVRRVLDQLLGRPAPLQWDDMRYARLATGRVSLTGSERAQLAASAERFPLFG